MAHREILVPVIGLGAVMVVSKGWLLGAWQKIYGAAHQADVSSTPGNTGPNASGQTGVPGRTENPIISLLLGGITEEGGGDRASTSDGSLYVSGTYDPSSHQFWINNTNNGIACDPSNQYGCIIPPSLETALKQLLQANPKAGQP